MPELPEVETIRVQLKPRLLDSSIVDAGSHWSAKFTPAMEAVGSELVDIRRRGKYLIFEVDSGSTSDLGHDLIIHLGMTGRLAVVSEADLDHPHLRAWWRLADGDTLTFHDARRFGRIHWVPRGHYAGIATLAALGPEPFDEEFTAQHLLEATKRSARHLKTQILSQRPVAGVGNIYADEAFWMARINPAARQLSKPRAIRLVEAIRVALQSGLDNGGTTLRDYVDSQGQTGENQHRLFCYGRSGEPCERCSTIMRRRELDGRGTTWCPVCQAR